MKLLGIETSCDDTSVAVVEDNGFVVVVRSANQDQAHAPFGGIVPELAGRQHVVHLVPLIEDVLQTSKLSWQDIDGIAVTSRPGLMGSLIVGVVTAKTLAMAKNKKLVGVNHLEGHILAPFLFDDGNKKNAPQFPYLALAVSGGHTTIYLVEGYADYAILGSTIDDAAGEAFDKFGKTIGLGFPGGVQVDRLSTDGNPKAFDFPRALLKEDNLQMSFSGLKSSSARLWESLSPTDRESKKSDLCASFQEAIVDVLLAKLQRASSETRIKNIVITGGVSANSRLRSRAEALAKKEKYKLHIPPLKYCTDNAAMIAFAGCTRLLSGHEDNLSLAPNPRILPGDFKSGNLLKGRKARSKSHEKPSSK